MNAVRRVHVENESIRSASAAVVASLPISYAMDDEGSTDVVSLSGTVGWAGRASAAIASGARAVVVFDPHVDDARSINELADAADAAGAPVVLAETYASSPTISALVSGRPDVLVASSAITVASRSHAVSLEAQVLEQIRVIRALTSAGVVVRSVTRNDGGVIVVARSMASEASVTLIALRTAGAGLELRGFSFAATVEVELSRADTARPGRAAIVDAEGEVVLPTLYESAHRAAWRHLAEHSDAAQASASLRTFAEDVVSVAGLIDH